MTGRLAVVTGAAGAIGARISEALGAAGYSLLLVDLHPRVHERAADLRASGVPAESCLADLTIAQGIAEVVSAARGHSDDLFLLVNNAGITRDARLQRMDVADFEAVIRINLMGAVALTYGLEPEFAEGASVISMSSRAALGNFGQANYVTSKSALLGFTRYLALHWAPRVRANAIAPGLIDSPMTQAMPPEVLSSLVDKVPMARIGGPADIASTVVWLASESAEYVNGQCITVCGGRSISA